MSVLHFVLSEPENEVVGQLFNLPENVYVFAFLWVALLLLQLLCHPAQHLNVVGVVHCATDEP